MTPTTTRSPSSPTADSRATTSSSSSRSPTCAAPRSCSSRSTSAPTGSTAGSRSRSRRCSPTTTEATIKQAAQLYGRAEPNFFIKIPGTAAGRTAIEETIYAGIPVNVTLLFSTDQYVGAADAYMRGIERRIDAGLNPAVHSVASLFISRWDAAVSEQAPDDLRNRLGIAVGRRTYAAYRELLDSDRWLRLANEGARPQRLLWASTGTKDPDASDTLYIDAFASPLTVNTMPEKTLLAFAEHGEPGGLLPADGGDATETLKAFNDAGIDTDALAVKLQKDGAESFVSSWQDMLATIAKQHHARGLRVARR